MSGSRCLKYMTYPAVEQAISGGCDTAIVSIGAIEQHGPHGPLGTDTIVTEEVALRLAERIDALVAPVLPIGFSPQHLDWPGSISLEITTLARVLVETISSLARHRFTKFVLFSGHGGNKPVLDLAARQAKAEIVGIQVIVFNMLALQTGAELRRRVQERLGVTFNGIWEAHGGEQETSVAMLNCQATVDLAKAPEDAPGIREYLSRTRDPYSAVVSFDLKRYTPWGSWGNARGATREQGLAIVETIADMMAENIVGRWER